MELTVRELSKLEREKEEESGAKKKVRRLKKGSCSSSLGDGLLFAGQPLVKGSSKQQSSEKMKKERNAVEDSSDFEGPFHRDPKSNFRKRIRRIKTSQSEPIMLGKILAKTRGKHIPCVAALLYYLQDLLQQVD